MKEREATGNKSVIFIPTQIGGGWEEKIIAAEEVLEGRTKPALVKSASRIAVRCLMHPLTYQVADAGTTAVLALDHLLR